MAVAGGTGPFTWSVSAGALPAGLTLNSSSGAITGSDVTGSTQTFTIKATDANGAVATESLTLTVNGVPSITTTSLATATQTETGYAQTLVNTGGTAYYSWSISAGALPTGLSLNPASGVISGTVGSGATTQTFTAALTDANGVTATKSLTITVNVPPNITTTTLPSATATGAYSQTLAVTGGTTPYVGWSISTGTLPTGLSLNASTGVISGTVASNATTKTFTVELTDANAVSDTESLTIAVNATPSITTPSLPGATTSGAYSQTLAVSGGTTPFTWSISAGILPTGLTLNSSTGVISGSSVTGISETFTVKATDTYGVATTKSLTITVNAAPTISTTTLAAATQTETVYSQTLAVTGGTTPLTWSLSTGTLPSGLSLNASTGVISGTVASNATSETFTVEATDTNGVSDTQQLTLTVNAVPSITTTSLPGGTKSAAYSQTLAVSGGTAPIAWSISSNKLPTGLTLNASTGVISGTVASNAASETFTVKATDTYGVATTKSLTITVNAAPTISTTTLAAATQTETVYSQTLAVTGGTTPLTWSLSTGTLPSGLSLNASTGVISGTVASTRPPRPSLSRSQMPTDPQPLSNSR